MNVHKVYLKDDYQEPNGNADNWIEDAGAAQTAILAMKYRMNASGGGVSCRSRWRTVFPQALPIEYQSSFVQYAPGTQAGYMWGFYFESDAFVGAHYGNGYLVVIEDNGAGGKQINIYEVAANVLTSRATGAVTCAQGTTYDLKVTYNPSTGVIATFYRAYTVGGTEDWITGPTWTDASPKSDGTWFALKCEGADIDWSRTRARRAACQYLIDWASAIHTMSTGTGTFKFAVMCDTTGVTEFDINDGIEIELEDSAGQLYEDLDGCVENVDFDTESQLATVSGRDWRGEGLRTEGAYAGGAAKNSDIIAAIVSTLQILKEGNVKASADAAAARTLAGKYALDQIRDLCLEVGYSDWQTFWRHWNITNTYPASGVAIVEGTDYIHGAHWVKSGGMDAANELIVYYTGGARTSYADTVAQAAFGVRQRIVIDPTIPDLAHANLLAGNLVARLGQNYRTVDYYDLGHHGLQVGQTITLTIGSLGIAATTALITEKEYGPNIPGIRFRVVLSGTIEVERLDSVVRMLGRTGTKTNAALAYEI
jgi:hypothetical protein